MAKLILALDFGGTKLSAALADTKRKCFLSKAVAPSPPQKNAETDRKLMLSLAHKVMGQAAPAAIGVSFGGLVQTEKGTVILSHHVPGWENFPLSEWLEEHFNVPAIVDNDANAGALGEWRFGAGQGCQSLLYVTVSTGVGGGWVLGGKVYHGANGLAGEIGHITIRPDGPICTCGRRGCLESLASGPAIARMAQERLAISRESSVLHEKDITTITAQDVAQAAETGDPLAQEVLREAASALGRGIAYAIILMNPEKVVVGGGVAKVGDRYLNQVRIAAKNNVLPGMQVKIVQAALGDESPLWGAVALAERIA